MGITLGHKYRWHATTEKKKKFNKIILFKGYSLIFANYDEIMG